MESVDMKEYQMILQRKNRWSKGRGRAVSPKLNVAQTAWASPERYASCMILVLWIL